MAAQDSPKFDNIASEHIENSKTVTAVEDIELGSDIRRLDTNDLENQYHVSTKTYIVLLSMGLTWGTCTLANVGPATTYSFAVAELGGKTKGSWIPNAALFPLIGLQPLWVSASPQSSSSYHPLMCLQ